MEEEMTLREKMDQIFKKLEEQDSNTKKKFSMPWSVKIFGKAKVKKNYAIVQTISTNGNVKFKMIQIEGDVVDIGKKIPQYHEATAEHVLRYKKLPLIIVPEWNMVPFSPASNYRKAVKEGELSTAQKTIISKIEANEIKKKSPVNWAVILAILALGAGAIFVLDYMGLINF